MPQKAAQPQWPEVPGVAVVAEVDAGIEPIDVTETEQADRRAGKSLVWREAKVVLVHGPGSTELHYGDTLLGVSRGPDARCSTVNVGSHRVAAFSDQGKTAEFERT